MFRGGIRVMLRVLVMVLVLLGVALPEAFAEGRVLSFHSRIVVEPTGGLLVTETIRIRLEERTWREGMFRDIPSFPSGKMVRALRNGAKQPWQVAALKAGGVTRILIGDSGQDVLGPGDHDFEITYRVRSGRSGPPAAFTNQGILSWPINGTEWGLPFAEVSAEVELPEGVKGEDVRISGAIGSRSSESNGGCKVVLTQGGATIVATRPLGRSETLHLEMEVRGLIGSSKSEKGAREVREDVLEASPPRRPKLRDLGGERILSWHSDIKVERKGDLLVRETIVVRALGEAIKRGIFRDIPRLREGRKGKNPLRVLSVLRDGKRENYQTKPLGRAGIRIRIGRPSVVLKRGIYTYEITYRTGRQLYLEEGRDALYWNVNGTEWPFPVDEVSATVTLPAGIKGTKIWGYTGKLKEEGQDYHAKLTETGATIASTRPFDPKENLSLVLEWPPGLLEARVYEEAKFVLLRDAPGLVWGVCLLFFALLYYCCAWAGVGIDPKTNTIVPLYGPPAGLSAAAVRYLTKMQYDDTCFSVGVIGLGNKRALAIEKKEEVYTLKKRSGHLKPGPKGPALTLDEGRLWAFLFAKSRALELDDEHYERIGEARKQHRKAIEAQADGVTFKRNLPYLVPGVVLSVAGAAVLPLGWLYVMITMFPVILGGGLIAFFGLFAGTRPSHGIMSLMWPFYIFVGLSILIVQMVSTDAWNIYTPSWVAGVGTLFACVLFHVFYYLIKAPTRRGRKLLDEIEGFRRYLSVAEEERLRLYAPPETPEKTLELFEEFLPYAVALGCEQQWGEQFEEVLKASGVDSSSGSYSPGFYRSDSGFTSGAGMSGFVSDLSGSFTGSLSSSASAPSSGGGGFGGGGGGGGGGGSGGGGGGGGGGGW